MFLGISQLWDVRNVGNIRAFQAFIEKQSRGLSSQLLGVSMSS